MLEMPNSFPEPEKVERFTAIRLRDVKTGKFVAGPNPDLVAKAFKRRPDPWATASTYVPPGSPTELIKHPNPTPPKKKFPKGKAAAVTGAALAVGGGAAAYSKVNKGWGADSAARVANTARKAKIREGFKARAKAKERASWGEGYPGGMKRLDAEDDFARRSHRKSVNFVERFKMDSTGQRRLANPKYPTSPPRNRSLTGEDKRYLGLPGGRGTGTSQGVGARAQGGERVDYQFTGNKRVRKDLQVEKGWKTGAQMVGASVAGGVVANQLPQTSGKTLKKTLKKIKER